MAEEQGLLFEYLTDIRTKLSQKKGKKNYVEACTKLFSPLKWLRGNFYLMGTLGREGPEGSIVVGIILPSRMGCVSNSNLRPGR